MHLSVDVRTFLYYLGLHPMNGFTLLDSSSHDTDITFNTLKTCSG